MSQEAAGVPALLGGAQQKRGVNVRPQRIGLRVPTLRIVQKVDKTEDIDRGVRPGHLRYGHQTFERVVAVFLKVDEVRRFDERGPDGRPKTRCASADGRRPLELISEPLHESCDLCAKAQWLDGVDARTRQPKRIPPPCRPGFAFLGLMVDQNYAPFWFICQSTAEVNARKYLREFYEDPAAQYLHEWRTEITTAFQQQERGGLTWYVPVFTLKRRDPPELYRQAFDAVAATPEARFLPYLGLGAAGEAEPEGEDPPGMPTDDAPFPEDNDIPF